MKMSLKWLNEFVDLHDYLEKPDQLAQILVNAGLEIEAIDNQAGTFQNVVVGQIIELGRHPNADKLTLCQVDVGNGPSNAGASRRQIVCGAKNHKQGDKVVVSLPGAVLPGGFAIKLSKIRDVESQGMLCSESELGFKAESEGILILPADAKVGEPFAKYWGLDDVVLEISITPNRADCLSHLGLAREISCLLDRPLKYETPTVKAGKEKTKTTVDLRETSMCPRYSGRSIYGVKIAPSPEWLKRRLQGLGVNSINNVVDVTNLVMLELGQPLHAFDADTLRGGKIIVEKAKAGEKFKTFDGTEKTLTGDELTIRDGERAVALGGVIGGLNSGVSSTTQNIFLESAYFTPKGVRRTSRRLAIDTDSAYRYSRGVDIENVLNSLNRAASLIQELAGGQVSSDYVDVYPSPVKRAPITVREQTLHDRLGYPVTLEDFTDWMERLHCKVQGSTAKGKSKAAPKKSDSTPFAVKVEAPSFRVDLEIEMDLVEEYARLNGYDKIPTAFPPLQSQPTPHAAGYLAEETVATNLEREGFLEARNYAFLNPKWQNELIDRPRFAALGLALNGEPVTVQNPLSEETSVMRLSLLPSLLQNVLHNDHRGVASGRLFEIGRVVINEGAKATSPVTSEFSKYKEPHRVALVAWGHHQGLWQKSSHPVVYDLKSALEGVVGRLQSKIDFRRVEANTALPQFLHPGQTVTLFYEGRTIGFIGSLHPAFREQHKLRSDVAVAELDLEALMRGQPRVPKAKGISKFPAVERDFSLIVANTVTAGELIKETQKVVGPLLQEIDVFDVFRGAGVPEGHQSVSIRVTLQDLAATLADDRIQALTADLLKSLTAKFAAKIR